MMEKPEDYNSKHRICPRCGCISITCTLGAVIDWERGNQNRATCTSCKWTGTVHDLLPENFYTKITGSVLGRFGIFCGDEYYAKGGFFDFGGSYDLFEDAIEKASVHEWWHVFDFVSRKIVGSSNERAYNQEYQEQFDLDDFEVGNEISD